jgi:molecular chaperone GrpE
MKEQKRDKHSHDHDKNKEQEQLLTEEQEQASDNLNIETPAEEQKREITPEDKLAEVNDKYLRLAAEFDNYRRRTAKERLDLVMTAGEETIKGLLSILDDMERALDVLSKADGDQSVAIEGTELIYNKLFSYLESKGLKRVESKGKELNTDFHEAIAQFPAQDKAHKNKIIDVVQHGYTLNGKIIRFAKVVVGI